MEQTIPRDFLAAVQRQEEGYASTDELGPLDRLRMAMSRGLGGNWSPEGYVAPAEPPVPGRVPALDAPSPLRARQNEMETMAQLAVAQKALTQKGAEAMRPARNGVIANTITQDVLDILKRSQGREEGAASALEKLARDTPASSYRAEMVARKKDDAAKPFYEREGFSKGVLEFGADLLANQGRGAGSSLKKGVAAQQVERDRGHKQFLEELGLGEKDLARSDIMRKLTADAERARSGVGGAADALRWSEHQKAQEREQAERKIAATLQAARIGASQGRQTPAMQHKEWVEYIQQANPKLSLAEASTQATKMMLKDKSDTEKFDEKEVTFYETKLRDAMGKGGNETLQQGVITAYTNVLAAGGSPSMAYAAATKLIKGK